MRMINLNTEHRMIAVRTIALITFVITIQWQHLCDAMDPPETATDGQNSVQMMVGKFDRLISKWNVFNRVQSPLNGAVKRARKAGASDHQLAFVLSEIEGELLRECNSTYRGAVEIRSLEELNNLRKHESNLNKVINAFLKLLFRRLDFLSKLVVLELFKPSNSTPNEEREQGNEGSNHRIVLCLSDAVLLGQIVPVLSEMNAKQVDNLWKVLIQLDINIITERQSKTETICALSNAFLKCDIEGLFDWVEECGDTLPPNFQKLEMKNPRLEFGRHQRERSQRRNELKRERTLRREAEHSNEQQNANIQINYMRASSDISINNAYESMMQCGATMVPDFSCCCAYDVRDEARIGDDSQAPGGLHRPQRQWERCRNASNRCAVKCKENCEFICCPLGTCVWAPIKCYTGCSGIFLKFRVWAKKRANLLRDKFADKVNKFKSNFQNDAETESEFRQYKEGLKRYSERLILELQQLANRPQNSDEPTNSTPNLSRKQSESSSESEKNGNGGKISANERKEKSIQATAPVEVHIEQQSEASSGLSRATSPQSEHHKEIQELPS